MNRLLAVCAGLCCFLALLLCTPPAANAAVAEPATPARGYLLVSAVGDQFLYLRQKESVGSHLEPYTRRTVKVDHLALDGAVLRGLEQEVLKREPGAKITMMRLNPLEMDSVYPQDREKVAIGKLAAALEKIPNREQWEQIIVVTPSFQLTGSGGMGNKLNGIGIYVQPLRNPSGEAEFLDSPIGGMEEVQTVNPNDRKQRQRSEVYIAPFSYTQLWIFNPKTLEVIQTEKRRDSVKLFDPDSTALDVEKSIPKEVLAKQITDFVERASARALRAAVGEVTIIELSPSALPPPASQPKKP